MKKVLILWLTVALGFGTTLLVHGQQLPQFTQYMFNQLNFNPAYAGSQEGLNLDAAARFQWVGIEGSPLTQSVGLHLPVPFLRSGVGLSVTNDILGAERVTSIHLSYAYRLKLGAGTHLAIGVRGGGFQQNIDGTKLRSPSGTYDGGINHNDGYIPVLSESGYALDLGSGIYFSSPRLNVGVSALHLLEPTIGFKTVADSTIVSNIGFNRHLALYGAYKFDIGNTMNLEPSLLVKSDLKKWQIELGMILTYDEFIRGGVAFRGFNPDSFDAVAIMVGIAVSKKMNIMYSYDLSISTLKNATSGSHEISLQYSFKNLLPSKSGKTIYNSRFL